MTHGNDGRNRNRISEHDRLKMMTLRTMSLRLRTEFGDKWKCWNLRMIIVRDNSFLFGYEVRLLCLKVVITPTISSKLWVYLALDKNSFLSSSSYHNFFFISKSSIQLNRWSVEENTRTVPGNISPDNIPGFRHLPREMSFFSKIFPESEYGQIVLLRA